MPGAYTQAGASVLCYHRRSGLNLLSLLCSTQQALPVSYTLTAGCHQRDCQSQPTETVSVELSKSSDTRANLLAVRLVTDQQLMLHLDQMLLRKASSLVFCYEPV